jgi:hypothetical protein
VARNKYRGQPARQIADQGLTFRRDVGAKVGGNEGLGLARGMGSDAGPSQGEDRMGATMRTGCSKIRMTGDGSASFD